VPGIEIKGRSKRANYKHGGSTSGYQDNSAKAMPKYFSANKDYYPSGGIPINRMNAKAGGGKKDWISDAAASIKKRGTKGKCTPITKPGCTGRAKALAKTFKKIAADNKKS